MKANIKAPWSSIISWSVLIRRSASQQVLLGDIARTSVSKFCLRPINPEYCTYDGVVDRPRKRSFFYMSRPFSYTRQWLIWVFLPAKFRFSMDCHDSVMSLHTFLASVRILGISSLVDVNSSKITSLWRKRLSCARRTKQTLGIGTVPRISIRKKPSPPSSFTNKQHSNKHSIGDSPDVHILRFDAKGRR